GEGGRRGGGGGRGGGVGGGGGGGGGGDGGAGGKPQRHRSAECANSRVGGRDNFRGSTGSGTRPPFRARSPGAGSAFDPGCTGAVAPRSARSPGACPAVDAGIASARPSGAGTARAGQGLGRSFAE